MRYFAGKAGARYCYAAHPTYRCPLAEPDVDELAPVAPSLGADPERFAKLLQAAHRRGGELRARVDGKLTEDCSVCGHRLERLGFRAWIDAPIPPARQTEAQRRNAAFARTFGGDPVQRETLRATWHATKREAIAWARHEHSRNAAQAYSQHRPPGGTA